MRLAFIFFLSIFCSLFVIGQEGTKTKFFSFEKTATVTFSNITTDYSPKLLITEMPKHRGERMEVFNYPANYKQRAAATATSMLSPLQMAQNFLGNMWDYSTPNDNDLAISDSGRVISVSNTNMYIKNMVSGSTNAYKSLVGFTSPINNLHQEFDPKVMYDPRSDRFVLVCLVGFVDTTSKVIIGFSQTNDPNGSWNLYSLPGNPLNNNLWTDYPMISMTEKELFLTVNLLVNNQPWQTGFVQSIVWQMKKEKGYMGLPLASQLHYNIKFSGKFLRNLCPVKGGSQLYSPNMYFLSNRNLASQNDSVFLVNVTDTTGAPSQTVTVKAMVSNQPYYFPPPGRQPVVSDSLATNDCRNLGAFFENNKIQYVHNTANPSNSLATVYYGIIDNPQAVSPVATGYLIQNDTMDFGYPNISYAGNSNTDNSAIINFNHTSNKVFTGNSAIRTDGTGNYSPILRIKNGVNYVNLLTGSLERWGDYTGSQRKYGNPGEVWVNGYYAYSYSGSIPKAHATWITQLVLDQSILTANKTEMKEDSPAKVFPNPAKDMFMVDLNLSKPEYLSFELYDQQGKLVVILLRDWVKVKQNMFSFRTTDLSKGIYFLKITGNYNTNITKKVVVE